MSMMPSLCGHPRKEPQRLSVRPVATDQLVEERLSSCCVHPLNSCASCVTNLRRAVLDLLATAHRSDQSPPVATEVRALEQFLADGLELLHRGVET